MAFEQITTTLYNAQGDKAEERTTYAGNSVFPVGVPHSFNESGNLVPSKPAAEIPTPAFTPPGHEFLYTYQYDSQGNWIEQTVSLDSLPDKPINVVYIRKITYY